MIPDDPRARFVLAQHLIENGRFEEARALLRSMPDIPAAAEWVEKLERGEPIDTSVLRWEPNMTRPMPPPRPRPPFKPGRAILALLMAVSLFIPVLQMLTYNRTPTADNERGLTRSTARVRAEAVCRELVIDAIERERLTDEVGSCMEWSFRLPSGQMRDVVRCHELAPNDAGSFRDCVIGAEVLPRGLNPN